MKFLRRKRHEKHIEQQQTAIDAVKAEQIEVMDRDLVRLEKLNKILGNGIGLKIYTVTGGRHD